MSSKDEKKAKPVAMQIDQSGGSGSGSGSASSSTARNRPAYNFNAFDEEYARKLAAAGSSLSLPLPSALALSTFSTLSTSSTGLGSGLGLGLGSGLGLGLETKGSAGDRKGVSASIGGRGLTSQSGLSLSMDWGEDEESGEAKETKKEKEGKAGEAKPEPIFVWDKTEAKHATSLDDDDDDNPNEDDETKGGLDDIEAKLGGVEIKASFTPIEIEFMNKAELGNITVTDINKEGFDDIGIVGFSMIDRQQVWYLEKVARGSSLIDATLGADKIQKDDTYTNDALLTELYRDSFYLCMRFLRQHYDQPFALPDKTISSNDITDYVALWDAQFCQNLEPKVALPNLIKAANFLGIVPLEDLLCFYTAVLIYNKDHLQIREILGVSNDFDSAKKEEEAVEEEYKWTTPA